LSTMEKHMPGTPAWFDLMTDDLEKARAFYGELLGWEFDVGPAESGHYTMCKVGGRNAAGMGQKPPDSPWPAAWSVYFAVEDVEATCALVSEAGGQVAMPPMDVFGEGRLAFCMDPTGAAFGLWQGIRHHGAQVVEEPGAMAWCEVNTRDSAAAHKFYARVFRLEPKRLEDPNVEYYTLHSGPKAVAGVLQMTEQWAGIPPHWTNYFQVASTDQSAARATELGGTVKVPAFDTPYGRIAVIADPQGVHFSIVQPPA
jgi:uncharacterized protein